MTPRSPVWHPYPQHGQDEPIPLIERAAGAWLYAADGRRYIDAISSWLSSAALPPIIG